MSDPITIVIYFDQPGKMGYPFDTLMYFNAYKDITAFFNSQGVDLYIARADSYLGTMKFSHGWKFAGDELIDIDSPITCDLIYHKELKDRLITGPGDFALNVDELDDLALDKLSTYNLLKEFMAASYEINSDNWHETLAKLNTEKFVLKPRFGAEGTGIFFCDKQTFNINIYDLSEPYLVQEFTDSSAGIPGIAESYHDLRILVFDGVPRLSFVRIPKAGSLLANLAKGGALHPVDLSKVPASALELTQEVDKRLSIYPSRIYTVDFMYENGKPYIVEINSRPGFPHPSVYGPAYTKDFHKYLLETLLAAIKKTKAEEA